MTKFDDDQNPLPNNTPEQWEAYSVEAARCAEDSRAKAKYHEDQAKIWDKASKDAVVHAKNKRAAMKAEAAQPAEQPRSNGKSKSKG